MMTNKLTQMTLLLSVLMLLGGSANTNSTDSEAPQSNPEIQKPLLQSKQILSILSRLDVGASVPTKVGNPVDCDYECSIYSCEYCSCSNQVCSLCTAKFCMRCDYSMCEGCADDIYVRCDGSSELNCQKEFGSNKCNGKYLTTTGSSLSTGAIIGIVVGSILGALLIVLIGFLCFKSKKRNDAKYQMKGQKTPNVAPQKTPNVAPQKTPNVAPQVSQKQLQEQERL